MGDPSNNLEVEFTADAILLGDYPFLKQNRRRLLTAKSISEVLLDWAPPAVRTLDGEFIFISATQKDHLSKFAHRFNLPLTDRIDVWSLLLEPFLDTEFDEAHKKATLKLLADNGVPADEVEKIRALVNHRMFNLTFQTWEWVHYGLYDVLETMQPHTWTTGWTFDRFYAYAMELANRGTVSD